MAKVIVSGNLNSYGAGTFEADRSTWGFGDSGLSTVVRSASQYTQGIYSALVTKILSDGNTLLIPCRWPCEAGKNYIVKAKVRTPSAAPLGSGSVEITLDVALDNLGWPGTPIDVTNKTVTEATDTWVEVEASVEGATAGIYAGDAIVFLRTDVAGIDAGQLFVDEFYVYEYINSEEEPDPELPDTDEVFFSRNPVTKAMAATAGWGLLTNYRLYTDVRVEETADSDTYTSKLKLSLPPDSAGNVMFQVREAFRGVLQAVPPTLNESIPKRLTDRIKRFKHYTGELEDDEVTPGSLTEGDAALVMLGGINKFHWPGLDFFGTYLPTNKKFLTWAPLRKYIDRYQEDYLNFFVYDAAITELKHRCKVYYTDGTNTTNTIASMSGVTYQWLYQWAVGPGNTSVLLLDPEKTVDYYEVWFENQDDEVITEVRTYVLDTYTHPRKRLFMFLNSLGAYEVLRFTGAADYNTAFTKTGLVKFLPYSYSSLDGEKEVNHSTLQESGSYSSGFVPSAEWLDYLKDFLLSTRVYDVTDGQRRPVTIEAGTFPTGADQNYERFIRFTVVDGYEDENYTPKLIE